MMTRLKALVSSWVIERLEPDIQSALETWMRTPQGKQAISDILAELTVDALGPSSGDDSLFVDFMCRLLARYRHHDAIRLRLLAALTDRAD
jgi:hypothetical protein